MVSLFNEKKKNQYVKKRQTVYACCFSINSVNDPRKIERERERMAQATKEPCKKEACDIQACLTKNNFLPQKYALFLFLYLYLCIRQPMFGCWESTREI